MTHPTVTVDSYRDITQTTWIEETVWHDGEVPAGEYMLVPVDGVVLSRQPCKECEGTGTDPDWLESGQPQFDKPKCPSCGGSGTTWPDELIEAVCQGYEKFAEMEAMADVLVPLIELAPLVLDALALVVQEGEAT